MIERKQKEAVRYMTDYRLVAFDLDGTFLTDEKEIPLENRNALDRMKEKGIYAVPATGRLYRAIPEPIRNHPAVRFAITENGAGIYDKTAGMLIESTGITYEESEPLIEYGKTIPCLYDCYQDSWGWMQEEMYQQVPDFLTMPAIRKMVMDFRTPLKDFESEIRRRGTPIQKFQYFFRDQETRDRYLPEVQSRFPQFAITKSSPLNIEINGAGTDKGKTLRKLCEILEIPLEQAAAFGDDINDISFLETAGMGIAMANGADTVRAVADRETICNNDGGVGYACRTFLGI